MTEEIEKLIEQDTIKLIKNTKGYNWEIKLVGELNQSQIDKLAQLDNLMRLKFNSE